MSEIFKNLRVDPNDVVKLVQNIIGNNEVISTAKKWSNRVMADASSKVSGFVQTFAAPQFATISA